MYYNEQRRAVNICHTGIFVKDTRVFASLSSQFRKAAACPRSYIPFRADCETAGRVILMKLWKRSLSLLIAAVMTLAVFPLAAAAGTLSNFKKINTYRNGLFNDVASDAWYADGVRSAYELGLMQGTGGRSFSPGDTVTLAQAVTMAARLHSIYNTGSEDFTQSGKAWYSVYADYAKRNGIIERDFADYNAAATRAQFASVFAHALPSSALTAINDIADGAIPDVGKSHSGAEEIYLLYRAGVLTGSDEALTFHPASSIQRSEAAAIVTRMAQESKRETLAPQTYTWEGDPDLDFTARLAGGGSFTLSDQAGKVVLINFWATWCGPCVREMPDIEALYEEYGAEDQVVILAVNSGESEKTVDSFIKQNNIPFPVAYDTDDDISYAYGITSIPRTVIFNKDGTVSADLTGSLSSGNYQRLKKAVETALAA